jgi:hypothetical protein
MAVVGQFCTYRSDLFCGGSGFAYSLTYQSATSVGLLARCYQPGSAKSAYIPSNAPKTSGSPRTLASDSPGLSRISPPSPKHLQFRRCLRGPLSTFGHSASQCAQPYTFSPYHTVDTRLAHISTRPWAPEPTLDYSANGSTPKTRVPPSTLKDDMGHQDLAVEGGLHTSCDTPTSITYLLAFLGCSMVS